MYGIEFYTADNALICGSAEFEVRRSRGDSYYRVIFGPDGMSLDERAMTESGWKRIKEHATEADIEAVLPQGDFGLKWTFGQFMLALTFYGEGHKRGYAQGEWKGAELKCNRIKYKREHGR